MSPLAGWQNFFVATVGASAALSGLVFVSVSISLKAIVESRFLRARAAETLLQFMAVLCIASCGLIPDQSGIALGLEIAGFAALSWTIAMRRQVRARRDPNLVPEARRWLWIGVLGAQVSWLPFLVAGVLLAMGRPDGLVWVAPGTLASYVFGAFNAWVLLVEIQS